MRNRDFIIGSLHGVDQQGVDMEAATSVEESPSLEALEAFATELGLGKRIRGHVVHDVERLFRRLRPVVVDEGATPVVRALRIERILSSLPRDPAAALSIRLTGSLRDQQLQRIGSAGLAAMRAAASLGEPVEASATLAALDAELARRGETTKSDLPGVFVMADGVGEGVLDSATERFGKMVAQPRLASALKGLVIIVVPDCERRTERALLIAHARAFARYELDPRLNEALSSLGDRDVMWVDAARVAPASKARVAARTLQAARGAMKSWAARLGFGTAEDMPVGQSA